MLRLIRESRGSHLAVVVRERRNRFSFLLKACLLGALGAHALFFALFRIQSSPETIAGPKNAVALFIAADAKPDAFAGWGEPLPYPEWDMP